MTARWGVTYEGYVPNRGYAYSIRVGDKEIEIIMPNRDDEAALDTARKFLEEESV